MRTMRGIIVALLVVAAGAVAATSVAQGRSPVKTADKDERKLFDLKKLKELRFLRYEMVSTTDLQGIGQGLKVVLMARAIPGGEGKGLAAISRLFVLEGERIEFDSFDWDDVSDSLEPGPNTKTFFDLKWSVVRASKTARALLVLTGLAPQQEPGEPIRTASRTLVMSYRPDAGFDQVADVTSLKPAVIQGGELKVALPN